MKKIKAIILAAIFMTAGFTSTAGSFSDSTKKASRPSRPSGNVAAPSQSRSSSSHRDSTADPCVDACAETCVLLAAEIIAYGWLALNLNVTYEDFPYQLYSPNYVINRSIAANSSKSVASEIQETQNTADLPKGRSMRFSADGSAFYLKNFGVGYEANFEGLLFPYVGPYIGFLNFNDDDGKADEDSFGLLKIGGQMSLFQHDILSCQVFMQWAHWFGETQNMAMSKNGLIVGADCRSYPVFPFALAWRGSYGFFNEDIYVFISDLQGGILLKRFELFGGWKYMSLGNSEGRTDQWQGVYGGVRLHF